MDQILVDSGLFGEGLVVVDTPKGVGMYNTSLADMGIEPTKLTKFSVDGIGWSPEIAAERRNPDYLGHGPENRVAILVSPDQDRKPIFLPTFSFTRRLMQNFLVRSMREVADITRDSCVCLQFENGALEYETPKDLLFLDQVTVEVSAGTLIQSASEQRQLVTSFMTPDLGCADPNEIHQLCGKVIASANAHGDLRQRRLEIPPFKFSLIGSFWSRIFGGVFVLRAGAETILIVEDETWLPKIQPDRGERYHVYGITDIDGIIHRLIKEDMLKTDLNKYYRENPAALAELDELERYLTVDAVCRIAPDCDISTMSFTKQKGLLAAHRDKVPSVLSDLLKFRRSFTSEVMGKTEPRTTEALGLLIARPNESLDVNHYQRIIWMLLQRLQKDPPNVLKLYTHDKERFFALFDTWSPAKKRWAARYVSANYLREMDKRDTQGGSS
jgi:hypothetical protein